MGGIGNGSSWTNAIPELADALVWAKTHETTFNSANPLQIFVAEGSYSPLYSAQDGANFSNQGFKNSFLWVNNTQIYGGFSPDKGATDLTTRDWIEYPTILEGNDEAYHVLIATSTTSTANRLDGVTIKGGNADQPSTSTFSSNGESVINSRGAGLYVRNAKLVISNSWFKDNYASEYGAAYNSTSDESTIINSIFSNNSAGTGGNAIFIHSTTELTVINSTFYNGTSSIPLISTFNGKGTFKNNIFYEEQLFSRDNGTLTSDFYNNYFTATSWGGVNWGNNQSGNIFDENNPFWNGEQDDFRLKFCSEAVNNGDNSYFTDVTLTSDYYGNNRIFNTTIDMGAIEYQHPTSIEFFPIGPFCSTDEPEDLIVNISGGVFTGTGVSNGKFNPQLAGEGIHEIAYTITEGICVVSKTIFVEVESCISTNIDTNNVNDIEIYPNPAKDVINVTLSQSSYIQIIDLTGRVMSNQNLEAGNHSLSLSGFNYGVYLLQVLNGENKSIHKFMIK